MSRKSIYSLAFLIMLFVVAACSDDDKTENPDIPKITNPLPDINTPQVAGSTITIIGTGFKDDCEVLLAQAIQTRWAEKVFFPTITQQSSTSISFIIPEGADGTYNVIIKQDGKDYPIGKITLRSNLIGIWQWIKSISGETVEEHTNQYFVIQAGGNGYYLNNGNNNEFEWDIDHNKLTIIYANEEKLEVTIEEITTTTIKVKYQESGKTWQEELKRVNEIIGGGGEDPEPPENNEVTTLEASYISLKEAICSGQYSSTEEGVAYGVCYSSVNEKPQIENDLVKAASNANEKGEFSVKLEGLTENTVYYYRAYLTTKDKTYYGEVKLFKTISINTIGYENNKTTTIFTGQYFNANVGLTEYGICYSMDNQSPTIKDTKIASSNANEKGVFSISVNNLKTGKTYYYRAYIIVHEEVFYGKVLEWEKDLLVGKWKMTLQEDVYSSGGSSNVYKCTHPGTMEFKTNGTGVQTGIHYGDLGNGDTDADWHSEVVINFHWTKEDNIVNITVDSSNIPEDAHLPNSIQATISSLTERGLTFSYSLGGTSEESGKRTAKYIRM